MIRRLLLLTIPIFLVLGWISSARAFDFPRPTGYVNDFANILSTETRNTLEQELTQLETETSVEITVVTVESLEGTTIEDYAVQLFEDWQIGKVGEDNGVLLLIALHEHEARIEVGYGLEPTLTDGRAGRIIREIMIPQFKQNNFEAGITQGTGAIIQIVTGKGLPAALSTTPLDPSGDTSFTILLMFGAFFLVYLSSYWARSKRVWPGGVVGSGVGAALGWFILGTLASAASMTLLLGFLGLLLDILLSRNYQRRQTLGLPTSWFKSGGGFFSGGGGGFGGFGGGSSGGGGASGRW